MTRTYNGKYQREYGASCVGIAKQLGIGRDKCKRLHKLGQLHDALLTGIIPKLTWPKAPPKTKVQEYVESLTKPELIEDSINDGIAFVTAVRDGHKPPKSAETVLESLRASRELIVGE